MAEERDKKKATEVAEKIEEKTEEKTMGTLEPKDTAMGEVAMITAGREAVHKESARRLQAKGSLL